MLKNLIATILILTLTLKTSTAGDLEQPDKASEINLIVYLAGNKIAKDESIPCIIEISNRTDESIHIMQPVSFLPSPHDSKIGYFKNGKKINEKVWTIALLTNRSPRLIVKNSKLEAIELDFNVDPHTTRYLKVIINRQDLGDGENTLRAALLLDGNEAAISAEAGPVVDAK